MPGKKRGRFIVLEGIDGVGTTTQAARLVARIVAQKQKVHLTCEPSDGPVGTLIRQVLSGRVNGGGGGPAMDGAAVALLFAADRLDHLHAEVEPLLAGGVHVVSDRYVLSSLAYQSVETRLAWVEQINARARTPDLTLFLEAPPAVALKRRSARSTRERFDPLATQRKVARAYKRVLASGKGLGKVTIIDARPGADEVEAAIWAATKKLVQHR